MKAVLLHEYGPAENLKYDEYAPEPVLTADSVMIETAAASINPIDWKIRSGARQKDFPMTLPVILGKDVSGVVREVGTNVRTFKAGDRVLAVGEATYAQYVVFDGSIVTHLPDGVNLVDAAAIPLVALTGDQLLRLATRAGAGQTIIVSGALGSVGRSAVHSAKKLGARVIAAVRSRQVSEASRLDVDDILAVDDDDAIGKLGEVDGVADTVGGEIAMKLFAKVKTGGRFGYASVVPDGMGAGNPGVTITRVFARPDASKVREYADDIRDGKFALPISCRMPLREAARAHALAEKGGGGKLLLLVDAQLT